MQNVVKHIVSWGIYAVLLFALFNVTTNTEVALIRVCGILLIQVSLFYLNLNVLIKKFYERQFFISFGIINLLLTLLATFIGDVIAQISFQYKTSCKSRSHNHCNYEHHRHDDPIIDSIFFEDHWRLADLEISFNHAMPALLAILVAFVIYMIGKRKKEEDLQLLLANAEKNFLRQQINPHFLFNVLNNIYSLSIDKDPKTPQAIMQLSKMLDYSLYSSKNDYVKLEEEIQYIEHLIALFKLRDSTLNNIQFDYSKADKQVLIAPMLLLTFVENALKHGNVEKEDGFLEITLKTQEQSIDFVCRNSYLSGKSIDQTGGIGIQNVERRLELLYPERFQLSTSMSNGIYTAQLKMDVNED